MTDFQAAFLRLRRLGYGFRTALRLARWATNPAAPLFPEHHQERTE
jgi:hypothetical protein